MTITDYIPTGRDNAVTRQYLCRITGMTDRNVREAISQARRDTPIISFGGGYYLPEAKEDAERWIRQETRRARSIFWSMRGARKFIEEGQING